MKKTIKICLILIMLLNIFSNSVCLAYDIWDVGKEFIDLGISEAEGGAAVSGTIVGGNVILVSDAKQGVQELIDFLWGIGLLTVFICTIVLGIKYMLVPPAEKSKIKQATTPYLIGVTIIFGAIAIWQLLIEILDGNL